MNIFPEKEREFELFGDRKETLNRLKRRTEKSENLNSQKTDKSFRGIINGNEFKLISSVIGKGAICVMTGKIESEKGRVKIEINKPFKVLLSIILCFPIVGLIVQTYNGTSSFSLYVVLITILQIFLIRYVFIELFFRWMSKESLNRLRDVLDFEWIKN